MLALLLIFVRDRVFSIGKSQLGSAATYHIALLVIAFISLIAFYREISRTLRFHTAAPLAEGEPGPDSSLRSE